MYRVVAFELKTPSFRRAVMSFIARNQQLGREELLDAVFRALDDTIVALVDAGEIAIDEAPAHESHLDVIKVTDGMTTSSKPILSANTNSPCL